MSVCCGFHVTGMDPWVRSNTVISSSSSSFSISPIFPLLFLSYCPSSLLLSLLTILFLPISSKPPPPLSSSSLPFLLSLLLPFFSSSFSLPPSLSFSHFPSSLLPFLPYLLAFIFFLTTLNFD